MEHMKYVLRHMVKERKFPKKLKGMNLMKKTSNVILVFIAAVVILTSCNAQQSAKSDNAYLYDMMAPGESYNGQFDSVAEESLNFSNSTADYKNSAYYETEDFDGYDGKTGASFEQPQEPQESRKIIYSSNFRIQTNEFDIAITALENLCEKYGAYYQSANCYGTAEKANRRGAYTVRIPVQNYKTFKEEAGSIGTVIQSSENNQDVTENYFDTEARLESAKLREERLLEILKTADSLDNILLLEAELADVRYEIESFSGKLRKYDSLISYSTIDFNIEEVIKPVEIKTAPKTFGQRITQALINGFEDFAEAMEDITVHLLYNLPSIIIFIVFIIIFIIVIKVLIKKIKYKISKIFAHKKEDAENINDNKEISNEK